VSTVTMLNADRIENSPFCGPSKSVLYIDSISLNVRILLYHRQNHTHYVHGHCFYNILSVMFINQSQARCHLHTAPPLPPSIYSVTQSTVYGAMMDDMHRSNDVHGTTAATQRRPRTGPVHSHGPLHAQRGGRLRDLNV